MMMKMLNCFFQSTVDQLGIPVLWLERHSGLVKVKDTLVCICGVNMQECSSAERSCVRVIELIITGETKNMVERN